MCMYLARHWFDTRQKIYFIICNCVPINCYTQLICRLSIEIVGLSTELAYYNCLKDVFLSLCYNGTLWDLVGVGPPRSPLPPEACHPVLNSCGALWSNLSHGGGSQGTGCPVVHSEITVLLRVWVFISTKKTDFIASHWLW